LVAALGVFSPYTPVTSFPSASPARYSLVSLDGSLLVIPGAWLAYKPVESIRVGGGFEALVGSFESAVTFSANPKERLIAAAEDPQYDAATKLEAGPIVAPSASFGATFVPRKELRFGMSAQLPFIVNTPATVDVRLPDAPEFNHASQAGDKARVRFKLA